MRVDLTYVIRATRPGLDLVPLLPHLAESFVAAIHQRVVEAAAKAKGYEETLQHYWHNEFRASCST